VCGVWGWLAALLGLAWLLARIFGGYQAPKGRLLARREMAFIDAAALALFPSGGAIEQSGADAQVAQYLDRLVAAQNPRNRRLMRALFLLVEQATLMFPAPGGLSGFRRFSKLECEQQVAVLEAWRGSRLFFRRLAFTSLRALVTLGYFAHPPVLRALGVAPYAIAAPLCEADLLYPRIGASRESIALTRDELTPPSDGTPLPLDGALKPGYDEVAS
jgi:hypothetical protein